MKGCVKVIDMSACGFEDLNNDEMQISGGECLATLPTYEKQSDSSLEADNPQGEFELNIFFPRLSPWWGPRFVRRPRWFIGTWF